jgi:hypothetical protein
MTAVCRKLCVSWYVQSLPRHLLHCQHAVRVNQVCSVGVYSEASCSDNELTDLSGGVCCAVLCVLQLSSVSQSHTEAVQQLQQELVAAQQHSQALTRQLQDMADSHMQVGNHSHLWGRCCCPCGCYGYLVGAAG